MGILIQGGLIGVAMLLVILLLLYKGPKKLRLAIYGHGLVSDVLATMFMMSSFPLTGITAIFGGLSFAILFSIYLFIGKSMEGYAKVRLRRSLWPFEIEVIEEH